MKKVHDCLAGTERIYKERRTNAVREHQVTAGDLQLLEFLGTLHYDSLRIAIIPDLRTERIGAYGASIALRSSRRLRHSDHKRATLIFRQLRR